MLEKADPQCDESLLNLETKKARTKNIDQK